MEGNCRVFGIDQETAVLYLQHKVSMKKKVLEELKESKVVAILRMEPGADVTATVDALIQGGIRFIEITMTMPNAISMIRLCSQQFAECAVIGAGTVLDVETATRVIDAGARFVVSPVTDLSVIRYCNSKEVAVMPGAVTPTEIYHAWNAGADVVKVFSARLGGAEYFRDIKGPFPEIEIMPTGGVDIETAPAFLKAGACAVGIGGALVPKHLVSGKRFDELAVHVEKMRRAVVE